MKRTRTAIRVRYVETDQMGIAHHSNYFAWMEAARTELLRETGVSSRELEERGFLLPVREAFCRYRKSLRYDDLAIVVSELLELRGASLKIGYTFYREGDDSPLAEGYTLHPFTDREGRVVRAPRFFADLFA